MFAKFLLIFVLFHYSSGVIYELSDEDYARMPPIFKTDDYEECVGDPQDLFCTVEFEVVSDEPSALLTMMQEYSAHFPSHYNYTLLRRGICITRTCKQFYEASEGDLGSALEACANETFYKEYKLKARMVPNFDCSKRDKHPPIDSLDIIVAVICIAILATNVVASYRDYYYEKGKYNRGLRYLYCFSIFRNWNRLVAPAADGREPRLKRLIGLHGIRTLTMFLVIAGHSMIKNVFSPDDERFIEAMFDARPMHILICGSLIMQTFLLISSFLLVYNWLIFSEKQKPSWKTLPNIFMMRWLRLTPSYALILALTATWFGRLASGPVWKRAVADEMNECRRVWWKHLLYINNYDDNLECMVQSWYLAADTQLYYMAVIVFLLCRTVRMRKVVLSLLFMIGLAIPTVITYLKKLDGVLIVCPELALTLFKGSPTFNDIYKTAHTNVAGSVVGMAFGYWVYDWQKTGGDTKILRKYRWLYWALFPLGALCCYSGTVYYSHSPPPSTIINLLYAAFTKPIFAILVGGIMVGAIFELEDVYRGILESPIWTIPSRLSFSAYLMHIAIIRNALASQTTAYHASAMTVVINGLSIIINSFIAAFFFYILVEGPFTSIIREWSSKPKPIEGSEDKDPKEKEDTEINGSLKTNGVARKRVLNKIVNNNEIYEYSVEKNR